MDILSFLKIISKDYKLDYSEIEQKWNAFNTLESNIEKWLKIVNLKPDLKHEIKTLAIKCQITGNDINEIISVVSKIGKITFKDGDLIENLSCYFNIEKEKFKKFLTELSKSTPPLLNNSPNACCGKFELLYLLLVRGSKKSKRNGDIEHGKKLIEFKGKDVRLTNRNITGKNYKIQMDKIKDEFKIEGNLQFRSKKYAFEPEKKRYQKHYETEFRRLNNPEIFIRIFNDAMGFNISLKEVEIFFQDEQWNYKNFIKQIACCLVDTTWILFDEMWIFNDGHNLKKFNSKETLKKSIWSEHIRLKSDYFRINQNFPLGWYIE
jgi:hypothetical protein